MLRIGMLTPRSSLYPALGFDILNGVKAALAANNLTESTTFITDNIGFGLDEAEIYTKAEKMLLGENADVVIACCDSRIAAMLQPLFMAAGKLLLVVNFGANLPESWQPEGNTINHSLNFCFSTYLTGQLAAEGKTAAMTASYYDAGYNQVYCIVNSFQDKGGSITFNHITHLKSESFTLAPLADYLATEGATQNLLCLFCADMAVQFYKDIQPLQEQHNCNLYVSPMMLEDGLMKEMGSESTIKNVKGYTPWFAALDNENNRYFATTYKNMFNKEANLFTVLGWETGLLIEAFAKELPQHNHVTAKAVQALHGQTLASPRGWLKLDGNTNHTYGPAWLLNGSGAFEVKLETGTGDETDGLWQQFTQFGRFAADSLYSNWRNTYLCI